MTSRYARVVVTVASCLFVVFAIGATRITGEAVKVKPLSVNEQIRTDLLKRGFKLHRDPMKVLERSIERAGHPAGKPDLIDQSCHYCGEYECTWYASPQQQCPTCYLSGQSWNAGDGRTAVCSCDSSGDCYAEIS